jgi:glycogen operon protein
MLSQGVPMITAGDEVGHTQNGNNNAYCQDNELTWIDWNLTPRKQQLCDFTRKVVRLWHHQPVLHRRKFFRGRAIRGTDIKDIYWLEPSGKEMDDAAWSAGFNKCLGVCLIGALTGEVDEHGETVTGDTLLILFNAHHELIPFTLPEALEGQRWEGLIDTFHPEAPTAFRDAETPYPLEGRSIAVLRLKALREGTPPIIFPRG